MTSLADQSILTQDSPSLDDGSAGDVSNEGHQSPKSVESSSTSKDISGSSITLRALVSTKEAGIIIGKGGQNVSELREKNNVKAGVSKVIQGVHDRVLSITGSVEAVAKAFAYAAAHIVENPLAPGGAQSASVGIATIRLLIAHSLMGSVIGRQGLKIKHIQNVSGVRMVASKELLPSSTERVVEVQGNVHGIEVAIAEISRCLLEDWERAQNIVPYQPGLDTGGAGVLAITGEGGLLPQGNRRMMGTPSVPMYGVNHAQHNGPVLSSTSVVSKAAAVNPGGNLIPSSTETTSVPSQVAEGDLRVQNISIPADMVGCIIGKGGSKITEIRRLSGSRISIARNPHDESGERMFTIQGTVQSNEKALFLLYNSLEGEKERRANASTGGKLTHDGQDVSTMTEAAQA